MIKRRITRRRLLTLLACIATVVVGFSGYRVHQILADVPPPPPLVTLGNDNIYFWQFHTRLSEAEKEHILDGQFLIVTDTDAMPKAVKWAFTVITGEKQFALANPGKKYQATDVVVEPGLPFRRLLFAGVEDEKWFVHYEHGGIGHSYSVLVFTVDSQNRLHFLWGGAGFEGAKRLEELRVMVAESRFRDDLPYYW